MTLLQLEATKKFGSMRKLAASLNISPSILAQANSGIRKPWPKLRQQVAEALDMQEKTLFTEEGWPKEVEKSA